MIGVQLFKSSARINGKRSGFMAGFIIGCCLTAPLPLASQTKPSWRKSSMSAQAWLTHFEQLARKGVGADADIVRHPSLYPRTRVDSVVDGLERIALGSGSDLVKGEAVAALSMAGSDDSSIPGIFERTTKIFMRSDSHQVRGMIIGYMPNQRERAKALTFLRSVAMSDPEQTDDLPFLAVDVLSGMGTAGRATIADLFDKNLVRDPRSIGFMKWFLSKK